MTSRCQYFFIKLQRWIVVHFLCSPPFMLHQLSEEMKEQKASGRSEYASITNTGVQVDLGDDVRQLFPAPYFHVLLHKPGPGVQFRTLSNVNISPPKVARCSNHKQYQPLVLETVTGIPSFAVHRRSSPLAMCYWKANIRQIHPGVAQYHHSEVRDSRALPFN